MPIREYAGGARRTSLQGDITASSTTITVSDATGYPTGATGPFVIAFELGVAAEEKVLVASRSGNTLTVLVRGYDGTTAAGHDSGATVDHVVTATDLREANAHVNDSTGDPHPQYLTSGDANAAYVKTGAVKANVITFESTTATTPSDLATVGPVQSIVVPPSGLIRIDLQAWMRGAAGEQAYLGFALSGAVTQAALADQAGVWEMGTSEYMTVSTSVLLDPQTPGGTITVTSKYWATAGTSWYGRRRLILTPQ